MGCMCAEVRWLCGAAQITLRIQLYPHSMSLKSTGGDPHTQTHAHIYIHNRILSSIADCSAEKFRLVGSISGRVLLDFSDVFQRF